MVNFIVSFKLEKFAELIHKINNESNLVTPCKVDKIINDAPNKKVISTSKGEFTRKVKYKILFLS